MKINNFANIIGLLLIVLIISYNIYFYFNYLPLNIWLLNSADMVFLPSLFKDIFLDGGDIKTWFFSPAPYFLDMLLYLVSFLICSDYKVTMAIFFTLQNILLFGILVLISREFFNKYIFLISSFVYIFVVILSPDFMYVFSFTNAHHFLTFVLGLYWLYFSYKLYCNGKCLYIFYLFILGVLLCASDEFFLFIMVSSVCHVGVLYMYKKLRLRAFFGFIVLNTLIYVFSNIIFKIFVFNPIYRPFNLIFSLEQALNNLIQINNAIPLFFEVAFLLCFIFCIFIIKTKFSILAIVSIIFTLVNLFGLIFVNYQLAGRYFLMLYPFVIMTTCMFFIDKSRYQVLFLIPVLLIFAFFYTHKINLDLFNSDHSVHSSFEMDKNAQCITKFLNNIQAKNGLSQYWQAKPIYMKTDIKVAQIMNDISYFTWITQKAWQQDKYDFVVIDNAAVVPHFKINKEKIIDINGEPNINYKCASSEILYYKNGLYIDELLAAGKVDFDYNLLYTSIGKKIDNIIKIENSNQKGIATYGPYTELKSGKYSFELVYSSFASDELNTWDVASDSGKNILAKGELKDTNGEFKIVSDKFELNSDGRIEVRTIYGGKGELKIKKLTIYKGKK